MKNLLIALITISALSGCAAPKKVNIMSVESYSGMGVSGSFVGYSDDSGSFNGRTVILKSDGSGYQCGLSIGGVAIVEKIKFALVDDGKLRMVLANGYGFKAEKLQGGFSVTDQLGTTEFVRSEPSIECKIKLKEAGIKY